MHSHDQAYLVWVRHVDGVLGLVQGQFILWVLQPSMELEEGGWGGEGEGGEGGAGRGSGAGARGTTVE